MNLGFSLFRVMAGLSMLVAGYDKIVKLIQVGFNPEKFDLLQWFLSSFHGEQSTMLPHLQIFFPKFSIYILSYAVPFWEFAIGVTLVLGIYRKLGATLGIALMAVFVLGTKSANIGVQTLMDQLLHGIVYFLVYVAIVKEMKDPLALSNLCKKTQ